VEVTDDGTPAQTTSATLTLKLQEDDASFTKLTGIVTTNNVPEAFLYNQIADKSFFVRVGDSVSIGDVSGTVTDIKPKFLLLKQGEQVVRLDIGRTLRELRPQSDG